MDELKIYALFLKDGLYVMSRCVGVVAAENIKISDQLYHF